MIRTLAAIVALLALSLSGCAETTSTDSESETRADRAGKSESTAPDDDAGKPKSSKSKAPSDDDAKAKAKAKSKAAAPKVAAAKGTTIKGTGYTYKVPAGWGPPTEPIAGFDPDSIAVNLKSGKGYADNVNVIRASASGTTLKDVETEGARALQGSGRQEAAVNKRVSVAGSESAHLTATQSMDGDDYTVEQFFIIHSGQAHVVKFSFATSVSKAKRAKVTGATLASWKWTN